MVRNARDAIVNLILAQILATDPDYELALNTMRVLGIIRREFGSDSTETLSDIKDNYTRMMDKYKADREVECHRDPNRNQVAEAELNGTKIWIGPRFFSRFSDDLNSRPRVFIHEIAHNIGLEHDMVGTRFNVYRPGTSPAQVAHHADSYAIFAYRMYTRDYSSSIGRNSNI